MDIQLEKIELMKKLLETNDESVIESIKTIFSAKKKDRWDDLTEDQKEILEESLKQADNGEVHDFKSFIAPYLK
jgi:TRAP-type C4-dicarboxylate transport system substrate-binding protein